MSQNLSIDPITHYQKQSAPPEPAPDHHPTKVKMQKYIDRAFAQAGMDTPEGAVRFKSFQLKGGRFVAELTIEGPSGKSISFGGLRTTDETYSSTQEARNVLYERALRLGAIDFILSEYPTTRPPSSLQVTTPETHSALPPPPSSGPKSSAVNLTPSEARTETASKVSGVADRNPPSILSRPLSQATISRATGRKISHPPPKPSVAFLQLRDKFANKCPPTPGASAHTKTLEPRFALPLPVTSPKELLELGGGEKPLIRLLRFVSGLVPRFVTSFTPSTSPTQGKKRARPDDDTTVGASGTGAIALPPTQASDQPPIKRRKVVQGASYRRILADHCKQSGLAVPRISFERITIDSGTSSQEMYNLSAIVNATQFELPKMCAGIEVGEERLSKLVLEALGIDAISD